MLALTRNPVSYLNKVYSSELINREKHAPEKPLAEGDLAPRFTFSSQNWLATPGLADVSLRELHQKPLVIVFYSVYWNGHGINLLKKLEKLQDKIGDTANILIVTSEAPKKLFKTISEHNFSFSFYFDAEQALAEKFGIFSEDRPTWNLFSGIETNVPLLSSYVISPSGQISFRHIDDFSSPLPEDDLLAAANEKVELLLYK